MKKMDKTMKSKNTDSRGKKPNSRLFLSRRAFLGLGSVGLAGWLSGCYRSAATPIPTSPSEVATTPCATPELEPSSTPSPPPTASPPPPTGTPLPPTYTPVPPTPTAPPQPTAEPRPVPDRATLMAHWPATSTSRVVAVRHGGVWTGDVPNSAVVLDMLDAAIRTLTGVADPLAVWRVLFDSDERVLLKVNCIAYNGPTQPAVTYAVAQRLQDAGVVAENILIFDRTDDELASAGYALNDGGGGVQCRGRRGTGTPAVLTQSTVRFFQAFDQHSAVINLPTPKQHGTAGISVAMKNHYGSIDRPGALHGNWCDPAIAELNAQPNVRDKTRLVVGAALNVSPGDWNQPQRENGLLVSFDPVALDTVARDILVRHRQAQGLNAGYLVDGARQLATAQSLGLGATEPDLIDLREVMLDQ